MHRRSRWRKRPRRMCCRRRWFPRRGERGVRPRLAAGPLFWGHDGRAPRLICLVAYGLGPSDGRLWRCADVDRPVRRRRVRVNPSRSGNVGPFSEADIRSARALDRPAPFPAERVQPPANPGPSRYWLARPALGRDPLSRARPPPATQSRDQAPASDPAMSPPPYLHATPRSRFIGRHPVWIGQKQGAQP